MKKQYLYILAAMLLHTEAFAFIPLPPGPVSPTFDGLGDAAAGVKAGAKKVRTFADQLQYYRDEALNKLKSAQNFVSLDMIESPFKKEDDDSPLSTARTVAASTIMNIKEASSVSDGFNELFIKDPTAVIDSFPAGQREFVEGLFQKKRQAFAADNMTELYVSARELAESRLPVLQSEAESLTDCYVSGNENPSSSCQGASASDEELGNWANNYKLQALTDKNLRLKEELIAMKAQYNSSGALMSGLEPVNTSFVGKESEDGSAASGGESQGGSSSDQGGFLSSMKLVPATEYKQHTPFEGSEEQVNAMPLLNGIYELLKEAEQMHNTKQQMPTLRAPFIEYEKMQALHRMSISKLVQSDGYVRDYFADYYGMNAANDLWFGKGCYLKEVYLGKMCQQIRGCKNKEEYVDYRAHAIVCQDDVFKPTEYTKRRGLSGQSISAYKLSKAEQVLELGEDSLGTIVVDSNAASSLPENSDENTLTDMMSGDTNVSNPSDELYAEEALREQELNRWQLGAQASKDVGADMISTSPKYGKPQQVYPVWTDEKRLYDQYLREKYNNMIRYFASDKAHQMIFALAKALSNAMIVDESKVSAYANTLTTEDATEKQSKVTAYRNKLKTFLTNAQKQNKSILENEAKRLAQEYDSHKGQSELSRLKAQQDQEMLQLSQKVVGSIGDLERKKSELYADIDEQMGIFNEKKTQYNDLIAVKDEAEAGASSYDDAIEVAKAKKAKDPSYVSGIANEAAALKKTKQDEAADAAAKAEVVKESIEDYADEIDTIKDEIAKIDAEIALIKANYIKDAVAMENRILNN